MRLNSLIHLCKSMPPRGVWGILYLLLVFWPSKFSLSDQLTWYSFEITPSVTSLEEMVSPLSVPHVPIVQSMGLQIATTENVLSSVVVKLISLIWEILLSWLLEVRRCFQKRVMFSLHSTDCIVVWASVCPALQTPIIIPVVVHCITNYRVAVIFIIEMTSVMLLPEALK